jgi:septal ring factor EnvC (AmiA/AmiB activator)
MDESRELDHTLTRIEARLSELEKRLDKTKIDKFFELATRFALPFMIALGSVALNLHDRVAYLESTSPNKYEYQRDIADIRASISSLKESITFSRDSFVKLDTKMDEACKKLDALKERVIKLEATPK